MTERNCKWCGDPYESDHPAKLYCSTKCRHDMGNFFTVVGKRIAADALFWRRRRGAKGGPAAAFQRVCSLLDEANNEFRDIRPAGAPDIDSYVAARNSANGIRFGQDR